MKSNDKICKIILVFIILLFMVIICIINKFGNYTYAKQTEQNLSENVQICNVKKIDLDEIINKNLEKIGYREEIIVEEKELEYITKYRNNSELYIGETLVSQQGRNGIQEITIKRTYDDGGNLINEEQVSAVVVKSSINKIIDIGTKIYVEPKKEVNKNDLDFNIALNKPSGYSLDQFTNILTDEKDKNNIFKDNAKYFYYIEEQYNINGLFVAAVGIHESAWGTSKIALNKKNLFGYGAYDSNPYNGAYSFESYAESIDLIARVFVKYYLNPKGTSIYDNQSAKGTYYSGNTLTSVNKKYASDKNWANAVYKHMQYLYNKL